LENNIEDGCNNFTRKSGTCIEEQIALRGVTNLEVTYGRMRMPLS
jgi:hypothetical protein